jgi:hypothetical protein
VEPPVAYRPASFCGAIGSFFQVTTQAKPTELQAEEPLLLTVRVTGKGSLKRLERPNLQQDAQFASQFHIENLEQRDLPDNQGREFVYRLRPRTAQVRSVPRLWFAFFKPGFVPDHLGYQTTYAPAIPLKVSPRRAVTLEEVEGSGSPAELPKSLWQLAEVPQVLTQRAPFTLPHWPVLLLFFAAPPGLCGVWYLVWLRRPLDKTKPRHHTRSRALRQAREALDRLATGIGALQAEQVQTVLTDYLRKRLDLPSILSVEVVARHLEAEGRSTQLAQEVADFFATCDAARFGPGLVSAPEDLVERGRRLLVSLEDEICRWRRS